MSTKYGPSIMKFISTKCGPSIRMWCLVLLAAVLHAAYAASTVEVKGHWNGGFQGHLCIDFTTAVNEWTVALHSDQPINAIDIWTGKATKADDGHTWTISSVNYNANEHAGTQLCMDFLGHGTGDISPTITVTMGNDTNSVLTAHPTGHAQTTPAHSQGTTAEAVAPGKGNAKYNYAEALRLSILFFDAQRSGKLPANNPIPWRGDSALHDKGDHGEDLTGGWYDAGDNVKFNYPMSFTTAALLWGMIRYEKGYQEAGQLAKAYDMIKWPLDYFLKCWIPERQELYVQVGDADIDHRYWVRPEDMTMPRPVFKVTKDKPGSDVAGDIASAFAAGSIAFKKRDPAYSEKLLEAAKSLFEFAYHYKALYTTSTGIQTYASTDYTDELAHAGVWLYKATGNSSYLNIALTFSDTTGAWSWNLGEKRPAYQFLLYEITKEAKWKNAIDGYLTSWMPGSWLDYTPCGLVFRNDWGCVRYAMNHALLALMASENDAWKNDATKLRTWALSQVNYALGDNNYCISYLIGFGNKYPLRPHHRGASCPSTGPCNNAFVDAPNPHILYGALVGGPDKTDKYEDKREDYVHNEVACDYNMGITTASAALVQFDSEGTLPPAPAPKCHC